MFELFAAVNVAIAGAYVVIGAVIIPQLRLRRVAILLGAGFFLTCALTHVEMALHAVLEQPSWLVAPHMWAVHVAQVVVDWGFILAMAPWRGRAQSTLARRIEGYLADDAALTREERELVQAVVRAGTTHEVTLEEVHRAVEAFAAQKRLEQRKDEFVAYASHELRTPAAVVYGASKTLVERGDALSPEQRRELLDALAEQGERLKRLIDQLLDLSAYETGKLSVDLRPLRLRETLAKLVEDKRVRIDVPADLIARADEQALERVVSNLVANACRYGEAPVTVSAEQQNGRVVVAVEDQGSGVPPEFVPSLFARFTRGHAGEHPEGAGLGLAIAAAYAKAQGAELRYVPAKPRGARFEFALAAAETGAPGGSR